MIPFEQKVVDLSRTLPSMSEKIEHLCQSAHDAIDLEALDALCYNGCYGAAGKFDGHRYIKQFQSLPNGIFVLRVFLASYYRDQNPDGYKRDEDGELIYDENGECIEEWSADEEPEDLYFPDCDYGEVAQYWFAPDGQTAVMSVARDQDACMVDVNGRWTLGTPMRRAELKECEDILTDTYRCYDEYGYNVSDIRFTPKNIGMGQHVILWMKHRGMDDFIGEAKTDDAFAQCFMTWGMATIMNDYMMWGIQSSAVKHFHPIKVAHRNGFVAKDENRWLQLLDNISLCHGNMEDPRNFMPQNFDETYDYWQKRADNYRRKQKRQFEIDAKNAMADAIARQDDSDIKYILEKAAYLCICFGNDEYDFRVLQNVGQFKQLGNAHGQCVYTNGYYKHENQVLMICTEHRTDRYVSTVTVDINNFNVAINLGHGNSVPKDRERINRIVAENMQLFRDAKRAMQQCRDERDSRMPLEALLQQEERTQQEYQPAAPMRVA